MAGSIVRRRIITVSSTQVLRFVSPRRSVVRREKPSSLLVSSAARRRCFFRSVQQLVVDFLGGAAGTQQRNIAQDDGEQVIEVVSHSAGQLSDRFHLLHMAHLGFQKPLVRHVPEDPQHTRDLAMILADRSLDHVHGTELLVDQVLFFTLQPPSLAEHPLIIRLIFRSQMRRIQLAIGFAQDLGGGTAQGLTETLIDGPIAQLVVFEEHALLQVLRQRAILEFSVPQLRFRALAFVDVGHDAIETDAGAQRISGGDHTVANPVTCAVRPNDPIFQLRGILPAFLELAVRFENVRPVECVDRAHPRLGIVSVEFRRSAGDLLDTGGVVRVRLPALVVELDAPQTTGNRSENPLEIGFLLLQSGVGLAPARRRSRPVIRPSGLGLTCSRLTVS